MDGSLPMIYLAPTAEDTVDLVATAGTPLSADVPPAEKDDIIEAMLSVYDPEIPVNIYDLGLIYQLQISEQGNVTIEMTLTAPACPVAGQMPQQVADAVAAVEGVGEVSVHLVWEPPWTQDRMSETAKLLLGLY